MSIEFIENIYAKKLICIYDIMTSKDMFILSNSYPKLFNNNFNIIKDEIFNNSQKGEAIQETIKRILINLVIDNKLPDRLADKLDQANFIEFDEENNKSAMKIIMENYDNKKDDIEYYFKNVFGFNIPKIKIILYVVNSFQGSKGCSIPLNAKEIALVGYIVNKNDLINKKEDMLLIILHEVLHSLINSNNIINNKALNFRMFEEALLDYFLPNGILAPKLINNKEKDVNIYHKENVSFRPTSYDMSRRLLPVIEEYKNKKPFGVETIWEFLKKSEFKEYLT
ncbi:MAG: hypothetical protein ACP5LH_03820 [Candidatus Micrarchaeia archaeon]